MGGEGREVRSVRSVRGEGEMVVGFRGRVRRQGEIEIGCLGER